MRSAREAHVDTPRRLALTWQIFGDCSDILQKLLSLFETKILALDEDESAVHLSKQALKARKDKYINDILGKVSSRVLASPPCLFALRGHASWPSPPISRTQRRACALAERCAHRRSR